VLNPSIELGSSGVEISCDWFGSKDMNKQGAAAKIMAAGIVVLIKPAEEGKHSKYQIMTFKTEALPIDESGKFSTKVEYLLGDLAKFKAFQLKKAFGVFVTLGEELNPVDISETIESKV
jgi:hypothetical protein